MIRWEKTIHVSLEVDQAIASTQCNTRNVGTLTKSQSRNKLSLFLIDNDQWSAQKFVIKKVLVSINRNTKDTINLGRLGACFTVKNLENDSKNKNSLAF